MSQKQKLGGCENSPPENAVIFLSWCTNWMHLIEWPLILFRLLQPSGFGHVMLPWSGLHILLPGPLLSGPVCLHTLLRTTPHTPEDHFEGLPHEFTFASHAPDSVSPCCLSPPWLVHPTINTSIILSAGAVLSGSFMRVEFVSTHRCFPNVWYRLSPCQGLSMDWFLCFSFCSDFSSLPNVFSIWNQWLDYIFWRHSIKYTWI